MYSVSLQRLDRILKRIWIFAMISCKLHYILSISSLYKSNNKTYQIILKFENCVISYVVTRLRANLSNLLIYELIEIFRFDISTNKSWHCSFCKRTKTYILFLYDTPRYTWRCLLKDPQQIREKVLYIIVLEYIHIKRKWSVKNVGTMPTYDHK